MKLLSLFDITLLENTYGENLAKQLTDDEFNQFVYSKGYYDIEWFTDVYLAHWKVNKDTGQSVPTPRFHVEIWDSLRNNKRTCIIVPRDHAKTTNVKMFLVWSICYKFDKAIMLVMPEKLGIQTIGNIRAEFESNQSLIKVFGMQVPRTQGNFNKKWTDSYLQFYNGVEIQAIVKKGQVRGQRPTLLIVDDPQELEDVLNEAQAEKFWHRFWSSVYNTLQPTGRCAVLGTVISENCLVQRIAKEKPSFNLIRYRAIERIKKVRDRIVGGIPLWGELWSIEALEERRIDIGDDIFNQEYQNNAFNFNHKPVFSKTNIYEVVKPLREIDDIQIFIEYIDEELVFGIDTAEGKDSSDPSTIIGRRRNGELAIQVRGLFPEDILAQKMDRIFDLGFRGIVAPERNKAALFIAECKNFWWFDNYIYQQTDEQDEKGKQSTAYGFHTNTASKKLLVGQYDVILRYLSEIARGTTLSEKLIQKWQESANIQGIVKWQMSPELLVEVQKFAYNKKGGMEAMPGYTDDLVMADMIANQARKMTSPIAGTFTLEEMGFRR